MKFSLTAIKTLLGLNMGKAIFHKRNKRSIEMMEVKDAVSHKEIASEEDSTLDNDLLSQVETIKSSTDSNANKVTDSETSSSMAEKLKSVQKILAVFEEKKYKYFTGDEKKRQKRRFKRREMNSFLQNRLMLQRSALVAASRAIRFVRDRHLRCMKCNKLGHLHTDYACPLLHHNVGAIRSCEPALLNSSQYALHTIPVALPAVVKVRERYSSSEDDNLPIQNSSLHKHRMYKQIQRVERRYQVKKRKDAAKKKDHVIRY